MRILLKENTECKEREDIVQMSIEFILELCAIEIPSLNLLLVVVYWPNSNREIEVVYKRLEELLQHITLKDRNKSIIIGGGLLWLFS